MKVTEKQRVQLTKRLAKKPPNLTQGRREPIIRTLLARGVPLRVAVAAAAVAASAPPDDPTVVICKWRKKRLAKCAIARNLAIGPYGRLFARKPENGQQRVQLGPSINLMYGNSGAEPAMKAS
ncbi:hypothetical protein WJX72_001233 [[Myrmecia] bisecta]|uniref:Uncharacterized protein n=1 Tax=[Myrmecia] bisecta TaxID=41462 RepID=A0AAW1PWV4_9CHLO